MKHAHVVPVADERFAPRLIPGDEVAIDPSDTEPKTGQITLFRSLSSGEFSLMRYQPMASELYGLEIVGVSCGVRLTDF